MKDLKIDQSKYDIVIQNGDIVLINGIEQIAQSIKSSLLVFMGEWFLNTTIGIDYLNRVFTKQTNSRIVRSIILRNLQKHENVVRVTDLQLNVDRVNSTLDVRATVLVRDEQDNQDITNIEVTI